MARVAAACIAVAGVFFWYSTRHGVKGELEAVNREPAERGLPAVTPAEIGLDD